ncbi:MAG: F0F1 ATP synthase subunit alpha [Oscillospiraceae bacterium]|jgi:F-type H+-transporting ATPase subunit alpha|nr:F0F1 ATP synthase subunit alpha [Oscillospiraceae bacterium]
MSINVGEISRLLLERLDQSVSVRDLAEVGTVIQIGDGIARVYGLENCMSGELLEFEGGDMGMALNLEEDNVGCVLFSSGSNVKAGSQVRRTGRTTQVPVGDGLLGRVVNPLCQPLDDGPDIPYTKTRPVETIASGVTARQPVKVPLQTGIMSIDAMIPIGRGQRQLIIGDRQTGKTAIAIDTIINQRDKGVICIYVAIGQKASVISSIVNTLERHEALQNTIVVASTSSDPAPLQFLAPYAACAMAEEFMYEGHKDVLIVYDDLSKHAVAYRTMSLLLTRPPGREAYPGDVFYLHSRLLERAAKLSDDLGGGSITALPIIETLAGDISAYIPTNVISITDGQIFLESELFFSGFRPAVNVGLSVSRVGGAAQTKAMKKAASSLRIELAQYRELQVFSQLGSDLDASTQDRLTQGARLMDTLKQAQYTPYAMEEQVIVLFGAKSGYLKDIKFYDVQRFNAGLLEYVREKAPNLLTEIRDTKDFTDQTEQALRAVLDAYTSYFKPSNP